MLATTNCFFSIRYKVDKTIAPSKLSALPRVEIFATIGLSSHSAEYQTAL